jgi:uridine kinase
MPAHLIAIAGGSGSGKTWLAKKLKRRFGRQAGRLSLDDFYHDLSALTPRERARVNFDHPDAIDWDLFLKCLKQIRRGEKTLLPRYDFATHTRPARPRVWQPRSVVFIDGLWLLGRPELRRIYSFTVFVDCAEELRLARRAARDQQERGRSRASVLRQWRSHVKPMHDAHVASQAKLARMIFTPDSTNDSLASLSEIVEQFMAANE